MLLDRTDGALARMLPPFRLGVGGPVAGGDQYRPWIHVDDLVALYLRDGEMAEIVTEGQRAVPKRPLEQGFRFAHADLDAALQDTLS